MPRTFYPDPVNTRTASGEKKGRPGIYKPEFVDLAESICRETGATSLMLGRIFGVKERTIDMWVQEHETFGVAVTRGRDAHNTRKCEVSLLQRAMGYEFTETSEETSTVKLPANIQKALEKAGLEPGDVTQDLQAVKRRITTKQMAPDVMALIFFMCNRSPQRWRSVQHKVLEGNVNHNVSGEVRHTVDARALSKLSRGKLEQLRAIVIEAVGEEVADTAGDKSGSGLQRLPALCSSSVAGG